MEIRNVSFATCSGFHELITHYHIEKQVIFTDRKWEKSWMNYSTWQTLPSVVWHATAATSIK